MILIGDCLEQMRELADNSVDAVVTDPPYALTPRKGASGGFMGKAWDAEVPSIDIWREVLRVLKPGGHVLSFGGTRTYHRMVVNIEDAGFEVRDQIQWLYGSGFPKSHNGVWGGTALKPANEPICLARKPLIGTVAQNVEQWGVGGLNIDESRIGLSNNDKKGEGGRLRAATGVSSQFNAGNHNAVDDTQGRWPANVILDEAAAQMLDEQSGQLLGAGNKVGTPKKAGSFFTDAKLQTNFKYDNGGGASRFFYCAKASKAERNRGLEGMPVKESKHAYGDGFNSATKLDPEMHTESSVASRQGNQNYHPTVKPIRLMQYLIKLITPPGGTVLDPFMGSGSTGVAAKGLGFKFIGIEMNEEYVEIARKRIEYAEPTQLEAAL